MDFIAFVAVSLIATIGLTLLILLPLGLPGRRRTLAALERAESGATSEEDLHLLIDGNQHTVFYMIRGKRERIDAQCVRLFEDLGVPPEDWNWGRPAQPDLMETGGR